MNDVFSEKVSIGKNLMIGFEHVLAMCPGTIAVPLIMAGAMGLDPKTTAFLVSANLFTSGIAILIQVFGLGKLIGSKYPIILGSSFAPLAPMILIGSTYGLPTMFGAIMASAVVIFILSFFMDKILLLFPPVVIGTFVTLIGVSLAPTAIKDLAGGMGSADFGSVQNLLLGLGVLLSIILIEKFGKGLFKAMSLLVGIIGGTIVGALLGMVNFAPIGEASWFQIVTPFHFGAPQFEVGSIVIMTIFCIINMIQCIGVFSVLDVIAGTNTDTATKKKGIKAQAVSQLISGAFNSVPSTMFNENVSLIDLTKVKSRSVVATAGIMLVIIGVFPKISAIITIVPKAVLGGATLALFGIITASGVSMLAKLNFFENNNFTIVGTSIAIGVGATFAPEIFAKLPTTISMICSNGLFMVSASAILLNLILNGRKSLKRE
ncbi:MAG: nucleobase:cation symporter-2 family protein [Acetivibrio sp.]